MKILMVASEAEPYSKTGGLADVIGSLPAALAASGHEVAVVLPRYRSTRLETPAVVSEGLTIQMGPRVHHPGVISVMNDRVKMYFVDYAPYFDRDSLYGTAAGDYADNAQRFMLLSRAALEIAKLDFRPDLFHCHEWQAAMVPVLLKTTYGGDPVLGSIPVLFTIHNLGYQGMFDPSVLSDVGLPPQLFRVDGLEFFGKVNYLKGAIVFSDALSTVSKTYAGEIQTPEYGHGLEGLLRTRRQVLTGVTNGANYRHWDPRTDKYIAAHYSAENLEGKQRCKRDLLETCRLSVDGSDRPVVGVISRLAMQKGADLIVEAADQLMAADLDLIMLGEGDSHYIRLLTALQRRYPERLALTVAHDEALAHKIEAGADLLLMPSRYEPCGLNQLYSMKYGTVPVVRGTGGLEDTVEPFDPASGQGTGFKFRDYTAAAMMAALGQALGLYRNRPVWQQLMRNGMAQDYSWSHVPPHYERIYESLLAGPGAADEAP